MNLIKNSLAQLFVCVVVRCVATWCMLDDWVSVVQLDELTEHAPGLSVRTPSARLHCMPPCKCDTVHDRFAYGVLTDWQIRLRFARCIGT